jgi:hypothetical protein
MHIEQVRKCYTKFHSWQNLGGMSANFIFEYGQCMYPKYAHMQVENLIFRSLVVYISRILWINCFLNPNLCKLSVFSSIEFLMLAPTYLMFNFPYLGSMCKNAGGRNFTYITDMHAQDILTGYTDNETLNYLVRTVSKHTS